MLKSTKVVAVAAALVALLTTAATGAAPASASTTLCVVGSPSSTLCPTGQGPGGAFALASTNVRIVVGSIAFNCASSTIAGTAPTTRSATTITIPITLMWAGCSSPLGSATIAVNPGCGASGAPPTTMTFDNNAGRPYTFETIPQGCAITLRTGSSVLCTDTISGPQTLGNGTPGAGGQTWVNGTTSASTDTFNADAFRAVTGCGSPGANTYSGLYFVFSPGRAPGMTVQP